MSGLIGIGHCNISAGREGASSALCTAGCPRVCCFCEGLFFLSCTVITVHVYLGLAVDLPLFVGWELAQGAKGAGIWAVMVGTGRKVNMRILRLFSLTFKFFFFLFGVPSFIDKEDAFLLTDC